MTFNSSDIVVLEKPDHISWEDIHKLIWLAHEENRKKGVVMSYPSLPGNEIEKKVGKDGMMLVALLGNLLIGSAAIIYKHNSSWWNSHSCRFAYFCFDSVHPDFAGRGVFRTLERKREVIARESGANLFCFDTNEDNIRRLEIGKYNGYKKVDYKHYGNHYNVVMAKWPDGCPYSDFRCWLMYRIQKLKTIAKSLIKR